VFAFVLGTYMCFAQTKAQRDEIGYRILDSLEQCIPVYDYDEGFPPDTTPTNLGVPKC